MVVCGKNGENLRNQKALMAVKNGALAELKGICFAFAEPKGVFIRKIWVI